VALVVLFAAGVVTGQHAIYLAMLSVIPMLAAVFAPVVLTAVVAVITFVAGLALAMLPSDESFDTSVAPLVAVIVFGAIAVLASRFRAVEVVETPASVERRKSVQFQLQTQADLDSMTGLLNRRGAIRSLGARNTQGERVIAFLDCDLFKEVNDQFGSEVGDEFLQAIAGRLRHRLPGHDTVARWDGDEFLLAIAADAASAQPALERLVSGINGHPIRTTAGPIPATVSVGAAYWGPEQDLEDVIARAGRALYSAKTGGRGRIVVDGGAPAADGSATTGP
jgi:diguanylate cyclase (GGDEF)-like protein